MSDKDRRIMTLQHDLNDGRIRLPNADRAFKREYIGEWKDDRVDAMAYAATATAHHECALCGEVLSREALRPEVVARMIVDHRKVCERMPVEVGDYVRWSRTTRDHWLEGQLVAAQPDGSNIHLLVTAQGGNWPTSMVGVAQRCDGPIYRSVSLRRIPRPGAVEQSVPVFPYGADRSKPCPTCSKGWGEHFGIACTAGDGGKRCAACGCTFNDHYAGLCHGPVPTRGGQHDPAPTFKTPQPVSAGLLVDGITDQQCCVRWCENRIAVEGGVAPPNIMTPAQVAAGRAMWLAGPGAMRSAELRAKVVARAAAEANPVRVDLEVAPWE